MQLLNRKQNYYFILHTNCLYCQIACFFHQDRRSWLKKTSKFYRTSTSSNNPTSWGPRQLISWFLTHHCLHRTASSLSSLWLGRGLYEFHQNKVAVPSLYLQPISELSHVGLISVYEASHPRPKFNNQAEITVYNNKGTFIRFILKGNVKRKKTEVGKGLLPSGYT